MTLKDIIDDYTIKLYELNRCINAPDMYGAMLFRGNAKLLTSPVHLYRRVFRIFEYKELGYTVVIVE
jgi:hypothetical protein